MVIEEDDEEKEITSQNRPSKDANQESPKWPTLDKNDSNKSDDDK